MKHWLAILLCLAALCLCACGATATPQESAAPTESAETAAPAPSAALPADEEPAPTPSEAPTPSAEPQPSPDEAPQRQSTLPGAMLHAAEPSSDPEPAGPSEEELAAAAARLEQAVGFIDRPLAELIAVFGEPESSDYVPSCLGSGEDGELQYDGFTVYTYRSDAGETVTEVR